MRTIVGDTPGPDQAKSFEEQLRALGAESTHRTTREALVFEEKRLRLIVQQSPVRKKLNTWDASMILANETRLKNISGFLALLDLLVQQNRIMLSEADDLTFLFHRTVLAAFEIGSVCYPSGSAAGQLREMQSELARKARSGKKNIRIKLAKPLIKKARRSNGKIVSMEHLREQVNDVLKSLPWKNGKPVTISLYTLGRYVKAVDEEAE